MLGRLDANSEKMLGDRDVQLNADYLNGLNKAERCVHRFTISRGQEFVETAEKTIHALARDEWGGLNSGGELLAAIVVPNEPATAKVLKLASGGWRSVATPWRSIVTRALPRASPTCLSRHFGRRLRNDH